MCVYNYVFIYIYLVYVYVYIWIDLYLFGMKNKYTILIPPHDKALYGGCSLSLLPIQFVRLLFYLSVF